MDTELQEAVDTCLRAAKEVADSLPEPFKSGVKDDPAISTRLRWIERQLSTLAAKLKAMQEDMEAGLSEKEMGFADPQEMQELLDDMRVQIMQLKAMSLALGKGPALG